MASFFDDNEDLKFYLERYIDWEPLVRMTEFDFKAQDAFPNAKEAVDFYKSVLELIGDFTANVVWPRSAQIDREHPYLDNGDVKFPPALQEVFDQLKEMQVHGMCLPRELGGMNCPYMMVHFVGEMYARADVSVAAHAGFHGGMALAALMFSVMEGTTEFDVEKARIVKTRFPEAIAEIAAGDAWGSMDITEPGAGSDMGALATKGEQDANGNWFVTGTKIFITSGHAKYHFVIARTEEAKGDGAMDGLKGLSMFLVKCFEDENGGRTRYAHFDKLEEKLGHHGSATVMVRYEKSPAALIGKRGDGFKLMLLLMNNARLGVAFESLGICEAACRIARAYAASRPSMGKTIDKHEMIADYLEEMETDTLALRALSMDAAYHEEMGQKIELMLRFLPPADPEEKRKTERELKKHQARSRRFTPLVKYFGSEKAVELSKRCIQIHGGYGYINEYPAEKLLRDAMVLPIYEGTSQIQSLMAMKDTFGGVLKNPGKFFRAMWRARIGQNFRRDKKFEGTTEERLKHAKLGFRVARLQYLQHRVVFYLLRKLAVKKFREGGWSEFKKEWNPKRDFALAMLHAERLTRILTDVAMCEVLLLQSQRFPERAVILERYLERAEPRVRFLDNEIRTTGAALLKRLESQSA